MSHSWLIYAEFPNKLNHTQIFKDYVALQEMVTPFIIMNNSIETCSSFLTLYT